jgi:hypothetical protein
VKRLIPAEHQKGIRTPSYSRSYSPEEGRSPIAFREPDSRPVVIALRPEERECDPEKNKNQEQDRHKPTGQAEPAKTDIGKPQGKKIFRRLGAGRIIIDCQSGSFQIAKGRTIAWADIL